MPKEELIRDYLADNLAVLEDGLELIQKEYRLPNEKGTTGRIDILARDTYGHLVIIEVKRSEQASRQALHELFKYMALLRTNSGLPPEQIRCMLVSTHWDELLVPYSDFISQVEYPVTGYQIEVDEDGAILSFEKIIPVEQPPESELCEEHICYFYEKPQSRAVGLKSAVANLETLEIFHYCIIEFDYTGSNSQVIYPYAIYIVLDKFNETKKRQVKDELGLSYDEQALENNPWIIESEILGVLGLTIPKKDTETGFPEKFTAMLEEWDPVRITRNGRLDKAKLIISDSQLKREIAGITGSNSQQFFSQATPQYPLSWNRLREKAQYCLSDNEAWSYTFDWTMEKIQEMYPNSTVSVAIYNPADILRTLYLLTSRLDHRYSPLMEIVIETGSSEGTVLVVGSVIWNSKHINESAVEFISKCFGDVHKYFWESHLGLVRFKEPFVCYYLGLEYNTAWIEFSDNEAPEVSILEMDERGDIVYTESDTNKSLLEFVEQNSGFLLQWGQLFSENSYGI